MSVIVSLDNIPSKFAERLQHHLIVRSTPPPKFNQSLAQRIAAQYRNQTQVQCFDTFVEGGKTMVCLPFSFYYHHCSQLKKQPLHKHVQTKVKFQGNLLQRQIEIKDEAIEILSRTGSVLLCLHTGFGKTIFTLYLSARIGLRAIVLCHRAIIMQQWLESIQKYLPACTACVLQPGDYEKHGADVWNGIDILVCNPINIPKIPREVFKQFGTVIVDEVHTICTQQFSKALFCMVPSYLIGLSATPFRSDGMDTILEYYIGPEMVSKEMKRFFNAYKLPTKFEPEVEETFDGKLNWNSVLESQATSEERNKLICKLVWYFGTRNILILVKRKDHALELKRMLIDMGEDADVFIHTAKKVNYDCRILIATYSKGGVGFDHPKLDMLITGADVEENFMQYLGRIFRRDAITPMYIDLRDDMPVLVKHSQSRLKICKDVGASVKDFYKVFGAFEMYTNKLKF